MTPLASLGTVFFATTATGSEMQFSFAIAAFGAPLACAVFTWLTICPGFLVGISLYFLSIVFAFGVCLDTSPSTTAGSWHGTDLRSSGRT